VAKISASKKLLEAMAVTAELMGTDMSEAAARVFAADLARYPEPWVFGALERCRREVSGRLTLAAVIERMDDGRPGIEEAWSMMPRDESTTVVWTREMAVAFGAAAPLVTAGDLVAARMAFKERYQRELSTARNAGELPRWEVSPGHDKNGRVGVIEQAVALGRISQERAEYLLPEPSREPLRLVSEAGQLVRASVDPAQLLAGPTTGPVA